MYVFIVLFFVACPFNVPSLSNETQQNHVGVNVYFYTFIERKYITLQSSGDQITAQCSPDDESNTPQKNDDRLGKSLLSIQDNPYYLKIFS